MFWKRNREQEPSQELATRPENGSEVSVDFSQSPLDDPKVYEAPPTLDIQETGDPDADTTGQLMLEGMGSLSVIGQHDRAMHAAIPPMESHQKWFGEQGEIALRSLGRRVDTLNTLTTQINIELRREEEWFENNQKAIGIWFDSLLGQIETTRLTARSTAIRVGGMVSGRRGIVGTNQSQLELSASHRRIRRAKDNLAEEIERGGRHIENEVEDRDRIVSEVREIEQRSRPTVGNTTSDESDDDGLTSVNHAAAIYGYNPDHQNVSVTAHIKKKEAETIDERVKQLREQKAANEKSLAGKVGELKSIQRQKGEVHAQRGYILEELTRIVRDHERQGAVYHNRFSPLINRLLIEGLKLQEDHRRGVARIEERDGLVAKMTDVKLNEVPTKRQHPQYDLGQGQQYEAETDRLRKLSLEATDAELSIALADLSTICRQIPGSNGALMLAEPEIEERAIGE